MIRGTAKIGALHDIRRRRSMRSVKIPQEPAKPTEIQVPAWAGGEPVPAWVEVETGRYQPRRIRGSFPGRELG